MHEYFFNINFKFIRVFVAKSILKTAFLRLYYVC